MAGIGLDQRTDPAGGEAALDALGSDRLTYPPKFVDQDDAGLRTVGLAVSLPAPAESSDEREVRRTVEVLVAAMSDVARRVQTEFVIEYEGEELGTLDGGRADAHFPERFFGTA